MYKSKLHRITIIIGLILGLCGITACSKTAPSQPVVQQGGFVKIAPGAYDSIDTAVVIAKKEEEKTITFYNLKKQRNYTLNYDGITKLMDKYGSLISVGQLQEGEVVDLQFLKDEKLLVSLMVSPEIWSLNEISRYELNIESGIIKFMNEDYVFDESTVVFSDGKQADLSAISNLDKLTIKGKGQTVYSITVETGHGYLSLENDDYLVGGWIEVGQKVIQKIEEDMVLEVPEGTHSVYLSHSGIEGVKEVKIKRNEETLLDVGDLKKEELIKYGTITITVEPEGAAVYIDGNRVDVSKIIRASYGLHQIMAKADGYDTLTQYIRVNENGTKAAITLDKETVRTVSNNSIVSNFNKNSSTNTVSANDTDKTVSSNTTDKTVSANSTESDTNEEGESVSENSVKSKESSSDGSASTGYKVTIESPIGVDLYVDERYVGVTPVSFEKEPGSHEIAIRKPGYVTRIYTIEVDDEKEDISFSFSDLKLMEGME